MDYFSFLPSDDGICCTFNGANYTDPELGIQSRCMRVVSMKLHPILTRVSYYQNISHHQPLKVNGNGYRMGLALVIDADVEDYSVTNGKFDGFKV